MVLMQQMRHVTVMMHFFWISIKIQTRTATGRLCQFSSTDQRFEMRASNRKNHLCAMVFCRPLGAIRILLIAFLATFINPNGSLAAEGRYALVIGISAYQHVEPLRNAIGDSKAIDVELRRAGFQVKTLTDVSRLQLLEAVEELATRAEGGGEVVFFFAGHGIQVGNTNYLLPVDFRASSAASSRFAAVNLHDISNRLLEAKTRFSLLVIDACRNNPLTNLTSRALATEKGLAPMTPATGQMIVYSAGSGQLALDRLSDKDPESTSIFVREFVKRIRTPGMAVREVIDEVREAVEKLANSVGHAQRPAVYDESKGKFFFFPKATAQVDPQPTPTPPANLSRGKSNEQIEDELWSSIHTGNDRADFDLYLREYPKGRYAAAARIQIDRLTRLAAANRPPVSANALANSNSNVHANTSANAGVTSVRASPTQTIQVGMLSLELPGTNWRIAPQPGIVMNYFHPNTNILNAADKLPISESVALLTEGDRASIVLSIRTLSNSQSPYVGRWSHDSCEQSPTLYFQSDIRSFRNSACRFVRRIDPTAARTARTAGMVRALNNITPNPDTMFEIGFTAYLEAGIVDLIVWADQTVIGSLEDSKGWLTKAREALLPVAQSRQASAKLPPIQKQ